MTNNVISISKQESYEKILKEHLDSLPDELKNLNVTEMVVIANTKEEGEVFSVLKDFKLAALVGLLEIVKMYILTSGVDYE